MAFLYLLQGSSVYKFVYVALAAASVFGIFYGGSLIGNIPHIYIHHDRGIIIFKQGLDNQDLGNLTKQDHSNIYTKEDHVQRHIDYTDEVRSNNTDEDYAKKTQSATKVEQYPNVNTDEDLQSTNYTEKTNHTNHSLLNDHLDAKETGTKANSLSSTPTYIYPVRLAGQQGSGVRSLSGLQCVFGSIYNGFRIVEPYFDDTQLVTRHEEAEDSEHIKFSSLFDLEYFNKNSREIGYPEMVGVGEFIHLRPKYTVYIYIREEKSKNAFLWGRKPNSRAINCFDSKDNHTSLDAGLLTAIQKFNTVSKSQNCIVRIIELMVSVFKGTGNFWTRSGDNVYNLIFGGWTPSNVTVVLTYWYHKFFMPVHLPLHAIDCIEKYKQSSTKTQFWPSKRIIRDAEKYEHVFLHDKNVLGIMLRAERVINVYLPEKKNSSLSKCFREVVELKQSHWKDTKPIVALDTGHFGSKSFAKNRKCEYKLFSLMSKLRYPTLIKR